MHPGAVDDPGCGSLSGMDDHAQEEIRAYATVIGEEIIPKWVPFVWEAFRDYRKDSVILSRAETKIITLLVSGNRDAARDAAVQFGLLNRTSSGELRSNRERKELEAKLALFGLKAILGMIVSLVFSQMCGTTS
jgi:thymidylate synthase (FAD)